MRNEYDLGRSERQQDTTGKSHNASECTSLENDLLVRDATIFCEKLCDEFNRRWNKNERFYCSKQRRAKRLFIVEELAVASDGERTVSRRYPKYLRSTLMAIADLTRTCEALHKLHPDCAVVIGNDSHKQCVPVNEAIMKILSDLDPAGRTAPGATRAKAA